MEYPSDFGPLIPVGDLRIPDRDGDDRYKLDTDGPVYVWDKANNFLRTGDPATDPEGAETLRRLGISSPDWRPGLERLHSLKGAKVFLETIKRAEWDAERGFTESLGADLEYAQGYAKQAGISFDSNYAALLRKKAKIIDAQITYFEKAADLLYEGNSAGARRQFSLAKTRAEKDGIPYNQEQEDAWLKKETEFTRLTERMRKMAEEHQFDSIQTLSEDGILGEWQKLDQLGRDFDKLAEEKGLPIRSEVTFSIGEEVARKLLNHLTQGIQKTVTENKTPDYPNQWNFISPLVIGAYQVMGVYFRNAPEAYSIRTLVQRAYRHDLKILQNEISQCKKEAKSDCVEKMEIELKKLKKQVSNFNSQSIQELEWDIWRLF